MTPTHNYLCIDPGMTSGWVALNRSGLFTSGELAYDKMIHDTEDTAATAKFADIPLILAVERANVNTNKGGRGVIRSLSWEMETIGCVKHFGRKYGHRFAQINRSDAKSSAPHDLLKELGWWHVGGEGHALCAAQILVVAVQQFDLDYWRKLVVDKGILSRD